MLGLASFGVRTPNARSGTIFTKGEPSMLFFTVGLARTPVQGDGLTKVRACVQRGVLFLPRIHHEYGQVMELFSLWWQEGILHPSLIADPTCCIPIPWRSNWHIDTDNNLFQAPIWNEVDFQHNFTPTPPEYLYLVTKGSVRRKHEHLFEVLPEQRRTSVVQQVFLRIVTDPNDHWSDNEQHGLDNDIYVAGSWTCVCL